VNSRGNHAKAGSATLRSAAARTPPHRVQARKASMHATRTIATISPRRSRRSCGARLARLTSAARNSH